MVTIRMVILTVATLASSRVSSTIADKSAAALSKSKGVVPSPPSVALFSLYWRSSPNTPESDALSPCALGCITAAAASSACLITTNVGCMCTDTTFQTEFTSCLRGECHGSEMEAAVALMGSECAAGSRSISASLTSTEIPPPSDTSRSPETSLAVSASPTTARTDIPPLTSIDTSHSPTPLVSALASPTSAPADIAHRSSTIISFPASSHTISNASTGTVPFLPQNSAAEISPISAADISTLISPSTTSIAGTSNGIHLEISSTGMSMALALAIRGGFAFL